MDFLHAVHPFFPFAARVFGIEGADGRRRVDLFAERRVEDELIHKGDVFLQADIVRQPMLSPVRALIDCVSHRAGVDGGGKLGIDGDGGDSSCAEAGEFLPEPASVARFVDGVVCRDVENIGIRRMKRNRDDRLAVLLTAEAETHKQEKCEVNELKWRANQHGCRDGDLITGFDAESRRRGGPVSSLARVTGGLSGFGRLARRGENN